MKTVTPRGRHPRLEFEIGDPVYVETPPHQGGELLEGTVASNRLPGGWYEVAIGSSTRLIHQGAVSTRPAPPAAEEQPQGR